MVLNKETIKYNYNALEYQYAGGDNQIPQKKS